jgi:hypothetical protein
MTGYNSEPEPVVVLLNGQRVLQAIYEWVVDLLATHHTIDVDDDGCVTVDPSINPDVEYCLNNRSEETAAVLADLRADDATVH